MLTRIAIALVEAHTKEQDQTVLGATIALLEDVFGKEAAQEFVSAISATKTKRKEDARYYIPKPSLKRLVDKIVEYAGL